MNACFKFKHLKLFMMSFDRMSDFLKSQLADKSKTACYKSKKPQFTDVTQTWANSWMWFWRSAHCDIVECRIGRKMFKDTKAKKSLSEYLLNLIVCSSKAQK